MAKFFGDIESSALNVCFSHRQSSVDNVGISVHSVRSSMEENVCVFFENLKTWMVIVHLLRL